VTAAAEVVTLAAGVADAILRHARAEAPRECCGLLIGMPARVDEVVPTRNLDLRQSRYQVDPAEHIRLNRVLRQTGRRVVGAYHSHPVSPAEPSPSDIAEAHYPEFIYLIVSLLDPAPSLRAYRIVSGAAIPVLIG
jgi:[CysO sulfur-carrier protein]-S-L-cysteine hydrolase